MKAEYKTRQVKLSYKERLELEQLPQLLEELEAKITALQTEIMMHEHTSTKLQTLADMEQDLETAFLRWEELEEKRI